MRYDIVRQKRRYEMFDKNSKNEILDLIKFFGRYEIRDDGIIDKQYIYYDTDNLDLFKSGIALFRTVVNGKHSLTMTLEKLYNEDNKRLQSYANKKNEIEISSRDSIFDYTEFMRNSFKNMFDSYLNIDPDYLLKKLSLTHSINTTSHEIRIINGTGFKCTLAFDNDHYVNHRAKRKASGLYFTVYQHSRDDTDTEYLNLLSKFERYCGASLTLVKKSKVEIARIKTSPVDKPKVDKKPLKKKKR